MKRSFSLELIVGILLLSSCAGRFTYIPSTDAGANSGHFLLFYNELAPPESEKRESFKPTSISVEILQEGKTIISDIVDAGNWNLYPVPEGVYVVNLEIDFLDKPITLNRTFMSDVEAINALNVDFWRVESVKLKTDVETKKATCIGAAAKYILDSKREGKKLTFEDIQRVSMGKNY